MSSKYTHNSKILNLYDKNNKIASQLLYGETFSIINKKVGRYHIKTTYDNYSGFIKIKKILKCKNNPTHQIVSKKAFTYKKKNKKIVKNGYLYFGSKIEVKKIDKKFSHTDKFLIKNKDILCLKKKINKPLSFLKLFRGTKYFWGGISINGVDCSGMVQSIYKLNGQFFPRDTKDQIKFIKNKISIDKVRMGDLFFWKGHVGLALNRKFLIHAYGPKKKVIVSKINVIINELQKKRLSLLAIKRYKLK